MNNMNNFMEESHNYGNNCQVLLVFKTLIEIFKFQNVRLLMLPKII